jgi:hypothetical protein
MVLGQRTDNAESGAFPPFVLRMKVFASFSKKKRFACFKSCWARWIATPPRGGSQ